LLSEDDVFNSHPSMGILAYRIPSLTDLFGVPWSVINAFETMSFEIQVQPTTGGRIVCKIKTNCLLYYRRTYTPMLNYISPNVVYFESITEFYFDAKSVMNLITNVPEGQLPFVNAKIGGSLVDFESYVDNTSYFNYY